MDGRSFSSFTKPRHASKVRLATREDKSQLMRAAAVNVTLRVWLWGLMERGGKGPPAAKAEKKEGLEKENRGKGIKCHLSPHIIPKRHAFEKTHAFERSPTGQKEDKWQVIITGWEVMNVTIHRGKHRFNMCNSEEDGRKYSLQGICCCC